MKNQELPNGWSMDRIQSVVSYYEGQTDEDVAGEIETAFNERGSVMMEIPIEIAPEISRRVVELSRLEVSRLRAAGVEQLGNRLSDREFRIATMVAGGMANQRIAQLMAVQEKTIRRIVRSVIRKLGAESREGIVVRMSVR